MFKTEFNIGSKKVGSNAPVLLIAEAGVSHFGSMDLAHQLLDLTIKAKADVFKTQFFDVDQLIANKFIDWKDRLRSRNLTLNQAFELKQRCEENNIIFLATAHDESRIPWLLELDVPAVKIGSGERNNLAFIQSLAKIGRPVILSTGMYRRQDVVDTLKALDSVGCTELALLQCTTSYPTPPEHVNLAAMKSLQTLFPGPVGYSDHTMDNLAVLSAVARGAYIIEKHITILRDVPNAQDWKVSCGPEDFPQLVKDIRQVEKIIGSPEIEVQESEKNGEKWALKSLVLSNNYLKGHILVDKDLTAKRSAIGIRPNKINKVIGKKLLNSVTKDQPLSWSDVSI
jgi:N,N'-diacetyllegionaminate synthase